jgi:two-component system, LuxR family, sensor histidine kinase DctS
MRLKLPRKNKRWQATWPDSVSDTVLDDGTPEHGVAPSSPANLSENLGQTGSGVPRKLRRWLMALFVLLTVLLLGAVTWLSYRYQASQASQALDEDGARAAGQIRAQLLRDVQTLQLLVPDTSDPDKQRAVRNKMETLLADRPDIVRMQWWRTETDQAPQMMLEVLSGAAPLGMKRGTLGVDNDNLSGEAKLALETIRVSKREQFSQPYTLTLNDNLGIEGFDLWVPRVQLDSVFSELRLTYSLTGVLAELVSIDIAREHDLALTLPDGTYLARRQLMKRNASGDSTSSLLDLPGVALQLKATNLKGIARFIPNFLTTLVFALGALLVATLVLLLQDVRKRLAVQRALQQQNALRKAMEDSLVTGLRARDMAGYITYVNPALCQMVGFSAKELIGRGPPMPYWAPEALPEYQARHANLLAGRISKEGFETVFMRKDGTRFPVLIFEAPLLNAQGKQKGWMSSVVDATQQRQVEAVARQQQEQLAQQARLATMGELSSSLSHELNQPLAAISSYATATLNMVNSGMASTTDIQDGLSRISRQAQRAGQVIRSVHDFVRRKNPVREVIDLRAVLNGVYPLIDLQAKQSQVQVNTKLGQYVPDVLADRLMIEQVMLNLTRNAVDAMKTLPSAQRHMTIEVHSHEKGAAPNGEVIRTTRFVVSDHGPGITEAVGSQVFSAFFSTKSDGMGMGLAICRSVVEAAHGSLWFENRPFEAGGGCQFIVELPAHDPSIT